MEKLKSKNILFYIKKEKEKRPRCQKQTETKIPQKPMKDLEKKPQRT
jgi:predicted AAA+ superfamily ATPase